MADQANPNDAGERRNQANGATSPHSLEDKRRQLMEMEFKLEAIELHFGALLEELKNLESFTLTSLLARIKGDRQIRIEDTLRQAQELQIKLDSAAAAMETLRHEVHQADPGQNGDADNGPPCESVERAGMATDDEGMSEAGDDGEENASAAQRIKMIQRTIDICDETRKGLLGEIEAASSLGKCKTTAFNAIISGALGATTDRAREELARQVRGDIRRLVRRFEEVLECGPTPPSAEELSERHTLARFEKEFDGKWFQPNDPGREAMDELLRAMAMTAIFLEKRMMDAKEGLDTR